MRVICSDSDGSSECDRGDHRSVVRGRVVFYGRSCRWRWLVVCVTTSHEEAALEADDWRRGDGCGHRMSHRPADEGTNERPIGVQRGAVALGFDTVAASAECD